MPQLPLTALRALDAVARSGSFRAAAELLCVTPSAVSHQIRHLEDWLGRPLFDRAGNHPRLLPHGAELARALALSLAEIEAACRRASSSAQDQPLVIAAIPSVAVCWLIPRLSAFRAAHPGIETRLIYAMHGRGIDFADVHLAFVFGRSASVVPGIRSEVFLPGASVPVCSPLLLASLGRPLANAADIRALGLLHDTDETGWQDWFRANGAPLPARPGGPVFEDFNLLRAAALSGQGAALCPLAMIRPDLAAGRLVQLSDLTVQDDHFYHLLSAPIPDAGIGTRARIFRDWAFAARDLEPLGDVPGPQPGIGVVGRAVAL